MLNKRWILLSLLLLLVCIPASFAYDNQTETVSDVEVGEYYFDVNVANDGNGSSDNPFKYLTDSRVQDNSIIHLASGEYNYTQSGSKSNVVMIGSDACNTIIRADGEIKTSDYCFLTNITFLNTQFNVKGTFKASNVVFNESKARVFDEYSNSYGGAIYSLGDNPSIYLDNCTFADNYAQYGGAIYLNESGSLDIKDCLFINNTAYRYGGTIACDGASRVNVVRSKICNSKSVNDAGGAIYLKETPIIINGLTISSSSAAFGGALTLLECDSILNEINLENNVAQYDGGAIYQLYGSISIYNSNFSNNIANNGAGLYVASCHEAFLENVLFANNNASLCAGAIYSISNQNTKFNEICYRDNHALTNNDLYESSKYNLFLANGNYTLLHFNPVYDGVLPSYYKIENLTIKDQQTGGNCWAFAIIGSVESCIYKASGLHVNLSEENVKNLMSYYSNYGWLIETNEGGYGDMALGYLTSWLGPINACDDLYDDSSVLSPVLNSIFHIQNVLFLKRDNFTDNDAIKRAIMDYGGVFSSINANPKVDEINKCIVQYYDEGTESDHEVVIVGWDDELWVTGAPGKGAWIVKNSWGEDWANDGHYYVSYYDTSCAKIGARDEIYTFIFNDTIRYDKNYQYDIPGRTSYLTNSTDTIWYKNKFTATDDEYLAGVSTYFDEDTYWNLSVYVNGALKADKSGFSHNGYYTIDLVDFIQLNSGDVFEVVFKKYVDGIARVPVSEEKYLNNEFYSENISFISFDGVNWFDLYSILDSDDNCYYSHVACIKAFTFLDEIATKTLLDVSYDDGIVNVTAFALNQYGYSLNTGEIIFNISGSLYNVDISQGMAELSIQLDEGVYDITAQLNAFGYGASYNSLTVDTNKPIVNIDVEVSNYLDNANITVNLSRQINVNVSLTVNGKTQYSYSKNGVVLFKLDNLDLGLNTVEVHIEDNNYVSHDAVTSFTVKQMKTSVVVNDLNTIYGSGEALNVTLFGENGCLISNQVIEYIINGKSYYKTTDSKGEISIPINWAVGNYDVGLRFAGSKMYLNSSASSEVTVNTSINLPTGVVYTYNSTYSINFIDKKGNPLKSNVIIEINKIKYNRDSVNILLGPGSYNAIAYNLLTGENKTQNIVVVKRISENEDVTFYYGDEAYYKIRVYDDNGNIAKGAKIYFIFDNVHFEGETDSDGYAYCDFDAPAGKYILKASYKGFVVENTFTIKSTINLPTSTTYTYNSNYKFEMLDSKGNNLSNIKVKIELNGVKYVDLNSGIASLPIKLNPGKYAVTIYNDLTGESVTQDINVVKRITSNVGFTMYYGAGKYYKVRVLDDNGNILKNAKVAFNVGGKTYYRYSDSNGYASFKITLNPNTYTISATYNGFKVSNKIIVKPTLILSAKTVKKSKTFRYTVKLLNSNGKILKYKKVVVKFRGRTYYAKTNVRGIATFNIKAFSKVGRFALTASYGSARISKIITIRK